MLELNNLKPPKGATHRKKRLGRGESSGTGKTSGRGNKGQKARAGGFHKTGFEGGQMPLQRRLPKRGFFSFTRKEFVIVNVGQLNKIAAHTEVDGDVLRDLGFIKNTRKKLKVLGDGEITVPLTIKAHHFSESAKKKIEEVGGKIVMGG